MSTITITTSQFSALTQADTKPILVDFWAPWCGYCRRIAPALEQIALQWEDSLTVGKVNVDDEPALAQQEQIEVLPTLVLYQNGQPIGSLVAPPSKTAIEDFLRQHLEDAKE